MDPITLSVLSGVLYIAYDKYKSKKGAPGSPPKSIANAANGNAAVGNAPARSDSIEEFKLSDVCSAAEVETFTHVIGGLRQFDKQVAKGLPFFLEARSAIPISSGPLALAAPSARVFRVMPRAPGAALASDVVKLAHAAGQTVLGTLTLYGLPLSKDYPMLLVVGGPELRAFVAAGPGQKSHFAILPPLDVPAAAVPTVVTPPAPATAPFSEPAVEVKAEVMPTPVVTAVAPAPKKKPNGAKEVETPPAVIVTEGEVKA